MGTETASVLPATAMAKPELSAEPRRALAMLAAGPRGFIITRLPPSSRIPRPMYRRRNITRCESARPRDNPRLPHDHGYFAYTREEMESLGRQAGWAAEYVGDWGHPRGQRMMCYRPAA